MAVSNVGDDEFWTGHPLAQANLYAFGRLAWDPSLDPGSLLDEWIGLTFPGSPLMVGEILHAMMDSSWQVYESYTAPLGIGSGSLCDARNAHETRRAAAAVPKRRT